VTTPEQICPNCFAAFETSRYSFPSFGQTNFWIDVCAFTSDLYYTVATVQRPLLKSLDVLDSELKDFYSLFSKAPSKIVAFLEYFEPELWECISKPIPFIESSLSEFDIFEHEIERLIN
jgi:hypothetical protein